MRFNVGLPFGFALMVVAATLGPAQPVSAGPGTLVRDSIPERYKWDLSHIYPSWEPWERDLARADTLIEQFKSYRGTLGQGPQQLLAAYEARMNAVFGEGACTRLSVRPVGPATLG